MSVCSSEEKAKLLRDAMAKIDSKNETLEWVPECVCVGGFESKMLQHTFSSAHAVQNSSEQRRGFLDIVNIQASNFTRKSKVPSHTGIYWSVSNVFLMSCDWFHLLPAGSSWTLWAWSQSLSTTWTCTTTSRQFWWRSVLRSASDQTPSRASFSLCRVSSNGFKHVSKSVLLQMKSKDGV